MVPQQRRRLNLTPPVAYEQVVTPQEVENVNLPFRKLPGVIVKKCQHHYVPAEEAWESASYHRSQQNVNYIPYDEQPSVRYVQHQEQRAAQQQQSVSYIPHQEQVQEQLSVHYIQCQEERAAQQEQHIVHEKPSVVPPLKLKVQKVKHVVATDAGFAQLHDPEQDEQDIEYITPTKRSCKTSKP